MNLDRVIAVRNDKTVYRDGETCVKVFGSAYSKADVLSEALNQARIEETGINIPKLLGVSVIDGKWAIVSEHIKGKTLSRLMYEEPTRKAEYIELLSDIQMGINEKECPLLTDLKINIARNTERSELGADVRSALCEELYRLKDSRRICHCDLNPSNVVIATDGTPYVIDWSHAASGDACADVAYTYLWFIFNGDRCGGELYLEAFRRKSNVDACHLSKWMSAVAASCLYRRSGEERKLLMSLIRLPDIGN